MPRLRPIFVALLVLVSGAGLAPAAMADSHANGPVDCTYPITLTDASGAEVTVEEEPERVTVLGASTAQVMWDIGAREKVVGMPVIQVTAYLEGSDSRTDVTDDQGFPVSEKVVGSNPDLVLAANIIQNQTVDALREQGLTVYRFESANSLEDVTAKTRLIGQLVGNFEQAAQVSAETEATVEAVRGAVEGEDRPMVYYALGGGWTAGPQTFIGDVIDTAGGDNIATKADIPGYAAISQEVLANNTIDWIVLSGQLPRPANPAVNESRAVAEGNVLRVDANLISQPGPRVTQPLTELATTFHGDAMADVDLDSIEAEASVSCAGAVTTTASDSDQTTVSMDDGQTTTTNGGEMVTDGGQTTAAETTATGDSPGFTVAVGVVALLAVALLGARRQ